MMFVRAVFLSVMLTAALFLGDLYFVQDLGGWLGFACVIGWGIGWAVSLTIISNAMAQAEEYK